MGGFDKTRAEMYRDALREYPQARKTDIGVMIQYLSPKPTDVILEIGAGNGFFSGSLADTVQKVYVLDPSLEQLAGVADLKKPNIEILNTPAENISIQKNSIDKVWSFGAVHHIQNKTRAFENIFSALKPGGHVVIGDVFTGSSLAKHFDSQVAKFCVTGHEVSFLSRQFAESLCFLTGFERPTFTDFNALWQFEQRKDIGEFLYKLHAMTQTTPEECLRGGEEILGVTRKNNKYYLNWDMTMMKTRKT